MEKRNTSPPLDNILKLDAVCTKKLVSILLSFPSTKTLKIYGKYLEISCHGIVWLTAWLAFIWVLGRRDLYQMQFNMMVGLIFDIIIIALLKASVRRRRPTVTADMLTIGPDKFSFPSGHASRAFYLLMFFTYLHPVSVIWWLPLIAWAVAVSLSRVMLQRHYLLDVVFGIFLGILEALFLKLIWISEATSISIINNISNDYLPVDTDS